MISKIVTILLFVMMLQPAVHAQKLQRTYQLDIKKSKILWKTKVGRHSGYLLFNSGNLQYSATGQPINGSFSMDMNNIRSTDNAQDEARRKTDANLKKEDFFYSALYPTATIDVKKITRIGSSLAYKVMGDLTIKGISKPIEFTATISTKDKVTHITANIDMSRQLWNIHSEPKAKSLDLMSGTTEKLNPDIFVSLDLILNK